MCVEYAGVVNRCGLVAQKLGWDQGFGWSASEVRANLLLVGSRACEVGRSGDGMQDGARRGG